MWIRFWGTRGSLPKPGPSTVRYGGNTSCVEVRAPDGGLIVLDCGTGAHDLGRHLVATGPVRGHLLITHTHWDHIQGFPFFAPLFVAGQRVGRVRPATGGAADRGGARRSDALSVLPGAARDAGRHDPLPRAGRRDARPRGRTRHHALPQPPRSGASGIACRPAASPWCTPPTTSRTRRTIRKRRASPSVCTARTSGTSSSWPARISSSTTRSTRSRSIRPG